MFLVPTATNKVTLSKEIEAAVGSLVVSYYSRKTQV